MTFEFVDKEDAKGSIGGVDYGASVRVMARSPRLVMFNGQGCHVWTRGDYSGNAEITLFRDRPTKAAFQTAAGKITELFGPGADDVILKAWREQKTVLVDGGGEKMIEPGRMIRAGAERAFAEKAVGCVVDLTGAIPACRQCGANLQPRTKLHHMGDVIQPDHPRTIEDCQRLCNHRVVVIHDYDLNLPHKWGYVRWFETWDGETVRDPYFCDDKCAARYGRRAAADLPSLKAGIEPAATVWAAHESQHHYDIEPQELRFGNKVFKI
jgi:hypothetical protein